jgi:hypothetical protein
MCSRVCSHEAGNKFDEVTVCPSEQWSPSVPMGDQSQWGQFSRWSSRAKMKMRTRRTPNDEGSRNCQGWTGHLGSLTGRRSCGVFIAQHSVAPDVPLLLNSQWFQWFQAIGVLALRRGRARIKSSPRQSRSMPHARHLVGAVGHPPRLSILVRRQLFFGRPKQGADHNQEQYQREVAAEQPRHPQR